MKLRLVITTVILLLLFSLKMGTGLLLHSVFHAAGPHEEQPSKKAGEDLSYACNCIDDFLTPFAETATASPATPVFCQSDPVQYFSKDPVATFVYIYRLRGPPALVA